MNLQVEPRPKQWAVPGIVEHPLRERLTNEIHARPSIALQAPITVSHLAVLSGEGAGQKECEHVASLCRRFGVAEPAAGSDYWYVDLGSFRLQWERRTEFSTYTFYRQGGVIQEPFRESVISRVPQDWLQQLNGEILVAIHLVMDSADSLEHSYAAIKDFFASDNIAASEVAGGAAVAFSDFRLQGDGFTRFYVRDRQLGQRQTGRLVQRLLEIETYRMMALLAFPVARKAGIELSHCEQTLTDLTDQLANSKALPNDEQVLSQISELAAKVEQLGANSNYRFSAARAYYALVQRRITELREQRMTGHAPIQEFMERRLAPAMRTCESTHERLENLSQRISRAANLLRTRVDVALEQQNRDLLGSMNQRVKLQLRLQETVEGLSVVVLSYYLTSLLNYVFKAMQASGLDINTNLLTGLAVPFVLILIWLVMKITKRILFHDSDA